MALFDQLKGLDSIRLVGTRQNGWYVENAVKAMEEEKILFSGSYSEPDYELMINEGCDLAIESTMILHSPKVMEMIEMLGIPVFIEHASYEDHPLGRTEWIKVYGAMLDKEEEAEAFFATQSNIIDQFEGIENTGKTVAFFYVASDDTINVRASSDYVPKMIEIAGGKYIFEDISEPGSKRSAVGLTMEEFYNAAIDADFLVYNATIDDPIHSIDELIAKDALFAEFKAVQEGNVWQVDSRWYQSTATVGSLITDLNAMITGKDDTGLVFMTKLK
jgi:iron complex transport system substrate-binding protein